MKKSAFISDILFAFFLVSLFSLCLFRYLGLRFTPSMVFAVLCGVLAAYAVGVLLFSKRKSFLSGKKDELLKQKLSLHLALLSDTDKTALLSTALQRNGETVRRVGTLKLSGENALYFLRLKFAPVTADELAAIARWKSAQPKTVVCLEIEDAARRLCTRLGIDCKTENDIYALFKKADALPESFLGDERPENKREKRLRACFARANAKRFLISGSLLLLSSLITPYPYYYLVVGGVLFLVAALTRVFGYK